MPIEISLFNLRSLAVRYSISFLSYLFEHLPQLEELDYSPTHPWLPDEDPFKDDDN
ncbi:unnamed protein product, partial [Rotaria sp. Silwood1]